MDSSGRGRGRGGRVGGGGRGRGRGGRQQHDQQSQFQGGGSGGFGGRDSSSFQSVSQQSYAQNPYHGGRGGVDGRGSSSSHSVPQQSYHQNPHHGGGRGGGRGGGGRRGGRSAGPAADVGYHPTTGPSWSGSAEGSAGGGYGRGREWRVAESSSSGKAPAFVPTQPQRSLDLVPDPVVSMMQSVSIKENLSLSSHDQSLDKILPVKRPDYGGKNFIRTCNLLINHFPVKFNHESTILHYDVDIKAEGTSKDGRPVKITKSILSMIRNELLFSDVQQLPMLMTAYDGEKNIFSAEPLPMGDFRVEVSERGFFIFSIKLVNELKLHKLKDYLSGSLPHIPREILQGMDLVMKENPSRNRLSIGRSFYPTEFDAQDDLGCGIAAHRGFQHSLKPTSQGLILCLDYSVLAFRKRLPVLEFLVEHIRGFDMRDFRRVRREVEEALKGLKVTVTHRKTKQKYVIAGLTEKNTRHVSFSVEGPEVSPGVVLLVDYFRDKYGKEIIYKDIPCLDLGKNNRNNYVPMEFCVLVEGQRYPKESLSKKDRNAALLLKEMSLGHPNDRKDRICNMVQSNDGPCGGGIHQKFGIEVNMNMTTVVGRVIGPPELKLGAPNGRVNKIRVDRDKCQWNLVGKSVVDGKSIERWAVLDFSASDSRYALNPNHFIPALIGRCRNLGMYMEEPLFYRSANMSCLSDVAKLQQVLQAVNEDAYERGRAYLQILVCVMSGRHSGYKHLKWISETRIGMMTQCCLSSEANKAKDQYLANLALKINAKLGGSNVELIDRFPHFEGESPVMFVGADVNHPGSFNAPSIAAVVATMNWPAANRYAARVHPQARGKEKILKFGEMCADLLQTFARLNKVKPKKIVIFRDGVSEGQFDMVLNEELIDIKRAIETETYLPTITLIIAQKRHQTRLFPESSRDGGSTGNVPPGTVVDTKIVHPFEFDFYLCSHYGSLGTSKATHYHVLWDEHGFTSDQLQQLIYNLCFTFARCTKPVSLVPPVYYADLVAYRGRLYQEALAEGLPPSSPASSSSSTTSSAPSFNEAIYKLHGSIENIMFFV